MQQFIKLKSKPIPLDLNNVDTDMIIPAQHLKKVNKEGYGEFLFSNLKQLYPDFILNNPNYVSGEILISRANFGCGSSREHAVWSLIQYGIKVVICSSYSDIFYNNATKNGLLIIKLSSDVIDSWLSSAIANSQNEMVVDLEQQTVEYCGLIQHFNYDQFRRYCLLQGLDDLNYLLTHTKEISAYEHQFIN
ncbi:MAG: 3-isopropylmalate dehydratase small subunit [Pseudomonadota bacterium]|nr:3-isopropylmalate dehydratase small subunit [Burkholderiales bacterium]